jgi:DNA-binding MarR family transcriptional regulator
MTTKTGEHHDGVVCHRDSGDQPDPECDREEHRGADLCSHGLPGQGHRGDHREHGAQHHLDDRAHSASLCRGRQGVLHTEHAAHRQLCRTGHAQSRQGRIRRGMEAKGLVERTPAPADRRCSIISATADGRDRMATTHARRHESISRLLSGRSEPDLHILGDMFTRYNEAVADMYLSPERVPATARPGRAPRKRARRVNRSRESWCGDRRRGRCQTANREGRAAQPKNGLGALAR